MENKIDANLSVGDNQPLNKDEVILSLMQELKRMNDKMNSLEQDIANRSKDTEKSLSMDRYITVIHLLDNIPGCTTHMEITNRKIDFRRFGETIRIRFGEFEELFYKYREWFENNWVALTKADEDLVELYGLTCGDNLPINSTTLNEIQKMPNDQLERLYNQLGKTQKNLIIRKFTSGYFEKGSDGKYPANPEFADRKKIVFLNELSDGCLEVVLEDLKEKERREKGG